MLLLFKSGWIKCLVGTLLLSAMLYLLTEISSPGLNVVDYLFHAERFTPQLPFWLLAAVGVEWIYFATLTLLGVKMFPWAFLNKWLGPPVGLFGGRGLGLALAGAALAACLEEPIFRIALQANILKPGGDGVAILIASLLFSLFHWTPKSTLLLLWFFPRSLWLGYLMERSENPLVPVLARGMTEFLFLLLMIRLYRAGFRHDYPGGGEGDGE